MPEQFTPPIHPSWWKVVHLASGTERKVLCKTAFEACAFFGWGLSECKVELTERDA